MTAPLPSASSSAQPGPRAARRRRWLPWAIGALLLAAIVAGLWPKPVGVEIATATRGELIVSVSEEGMTRVKHRYVVSAPVGGQLQRIDWKAGMKVEAGKMVLAVIETTEASFLDESAQAQAQAQVRAAQANQARAAADVERAHAAHELAASDLTRFRALAERKAISQQDLESATMREQTTAQDERAAGFARQVAEFELEQARAVFTRGTHSKAEQSLQPPLVITSPISGSILRVYEESARVVSPGMPLLEIGDPTDLELRIEVLSRDGVAIRPGARMSVEQWGGPAPLQARVRWVEPSAFTKISALGVEEQRVYVIGDFVDPLEKRATLGDNYRVEGRIVTWEGKDVLHVPAGALFQRGGAWQTFVVRGGRAELRTVQAGHSNGFETEILSGLQPDERVVVYPGDRVAPGVRVTELHVANR